MVNVAKSLSICLMTGLLIFHSWLSLRTAFHHTTSSSVAATGELLSEDTSASSNKRSQASSGSKWNCIDLIELCTQHGKDKPPATGGFKSVNWTLALGDPFLRGGFRNQVMRFTALIGHAWGNGFDQVLLPSIKWYGSGSRKGPDAVHFDLLFDVEHWNSAQFTGLLPKLVNYDPIEHYEWNPEATVFYDVCQDMANYAYRPFKTDLKPRFEKAKHPVGIGGGGGTGWLWHNYRKFFDKSGYITLPNKTNAPLEQLERFMALALQPSPPMRELIDSIRASRAPSGGDYVAFHARFEPEMLNHGMCREDKVRDLTMVLDQISSFEDFLPLDSLFVAVGMPQMLEPYRWQAHKDTHKKNVESLQKAFKVGLPRSGTADMKLWTAGEEAVEHLVAPCMEQIVSSYVGWEIAVEAKAFVGTVTSTWSVSVWKSRYFRGLPNYAYTPNGIVKLEGAPEPFKC